MPGGFRGQPGIDVIVKGEHRDFAYRPAFGQFYLIVCQTPSAFSTQDGDGG